MSYRQFFGKWFAVPEETELAAKNKKEVVKITTFEQLCDELLKPADASKQSHYGFVQRKSNKVPTAMSLNMFLWYLDSVNTREKKKKYKISGRCLSNFIDYCHFNTLPKDMEFSRVACGASLKGIVYYYTLVDEHENIILALSTQLVNMSYQKSVKNIIQDCSSSKRSAYKRNLSQEALQKDQYRIKTGPSKPYLHARYDKRLLNSLENTLELDPDKSFSIEDEDDGRNPIVNDIQPDSNVLNNNNADWLPEEEITIDDINHSSFSDFLPASPNISAIPRANSSIINQSLVDESLRNQINSHPIITSLLEPDVNESNMDVLPANSLVTAEQTLLNETLVDTLREHHFANANNISENSMNDDFLRKLGNEEKRAQHRNKQGKTYTGYIRTGDVRENPGVNPESKPSKSFKNQDDDFLDYAFYGMIRESGTVVTEIMKLPLGFDYNSQRRGSNVYIRAIHFKNTFTHVSGSKAQGRMIIFASSKEASSDGLFGRSFNSIAPHDILQKSVTMYAGDIEELETIDMFYNPTVLSPYDFKNIVLGNQYTILWDYYAEMNTQAVKGVVGEDIESVDSVKTKWAKIDGLDIPLFYDGNDKVPTRGVLGVLFMGDYFGGIVETNLVMRVYYNSK